MSPTCCQGTCQQRCWQFFYSCILAAHPKGVSNLCPIYNQFAWSLEPGLREALVEPLRNNRFRVSLKSYCSVSASEVRLNRYPDVFLLSENTHRLLGTMELWESVASSLPTDITSVSRYISTRLEVELVR